MATAVGTLTLYREKTLFFDGAHPGPDLERFARLAIRSNRITCTLTAGPVIENIVVRGHNIPSCLRFAGFVLDAFKADPSAFHEHSTVDWNDLASRAISDFDGAFMPETWLSAYANGRKVFASQTQFGDTAMDALEREVKGGDIDEFLLKKQAAALTGLKQSRIRHDSQAAVVMNENTDGVRCAVIERRRGKDSAFSFQVMNPPKKRIRMTPVLHMAADLFEFQNLYAIAERVAKVLGGELPQAEMPIGLDQVEAMTTRNMQLTSLIKSFHEIHTVRYRPAPPAYLPIAARS